MNCKTVLYVLTSCFLGAQLSTAQGPITPSAAPAPTMKTLQEMEPRGMIKAVPTTITKPGSYYFTKNLDCSVPGVDAINITADDVTIDMRGFVLTTTNDTISGNGIYSQGLNLKVFNGKIIGFNGTDPNPGSTTAAAGIKTTAPHALIRDVIFNLNNEGVHIGINGRLENIGVYDNSIGIITEDGSVLTGCRALYNWGYGIEVTTGCVVNKCTASDNWNSGIHITASEGMDIYATSCAILTECTSQYNGAHGILAEASANIINCAADGNGSSFDMPALANGNGITMNAGSTGVNISDGGIIKNCSANNNYGHGISVVSDAQVIENTANNNGKGDPTGTILAGISASGNNNRIVENTTAGNGLGSLGWQVVGVLVSGMQNRIEENHSANNITAAFMIPPGGAFNFIVKNTAFGTPASSDYSIVAGNHVGSIITPLTTTAATPLPGSSGLGIAAGVTDTPWANFDD